MRAAKGSDGSCGLVVEYLAYFEKCISRESNPGLIDGNDEFYH